MKTASAHTIVAIDGPAASGKSSVARELARRLGFVYVNSGAMYRAITWLALERGILLGDHTAIVELAEKAALRSTLRDHDSILLIGDLDPEPFLHQDKVNDNVSLVSSVPRVREILVDHLRRYALTNDLVMEGRDIGSVVFPDTPYKFYIDASPDIRLRRREAQGLRDRISARDKADSSRRASPLIIADDAHVIDSSSLTIDGVVGEIIGRLKLKGLAIAQ
ncbi:MAG TPA: (d)CMP kinase [Chthoniobacterales bacterium]|jgi:cytidylate kinase